MDIPNIIATIQIYIHHMKDVEVNIVPDLPRELPKLLSAYGTASDWLDNNIIKKN